jgi:hypothetical protein
MKSRDRLLGFAASVGMLFALVPHRLFGCGLDWTLPVNHFDGVNEQGYVAYWEKVGEVDLGDDLKLPLVIGFRSNHETGIPSPYLGQGWIMPLLESSMVQTGENSFVMMQPDGWNNLFLRKDATILNGSAGWMAEIKGDKIIASAPCGWRLEFYKGHIISMTTPKNRKLEFDYSGNVVTAMRENGVARLSVEQESTGQVKALLFNGKRMEIAQDQKPRVQNIAGRNVVGGMERSLKSLNPSNGTSKSFEFAVNDKVQPTLKITSQANTERLFTWDPATKRIACDNDWTYNITPNVDASIKRIRHGEIEMWSREPQKGLETSLLSNGNQEVIHRFASGPLSGAVRKIQQVAHGVSQTVYSATYSEIGKLLRENVGATVFEYKYDASAKLARVFKNAELLKTLEYKGDRLAREVYANGLNRVFEYENGHVQITNKLPNGTVYFETKNNN